MSPVFRRENEYTFKIYSCSAYGRFARKERGGADRPKDIETVLSAHSI